MLGHVFANTSTFICILQYQYNILPLWSLSQQCFKTKSPGGFFKHILLDPSALTPRAPLFSVSCFGGRMRQKTRMLPRSSWWNLITSIWGTGVYHRFGIVVIFVFYWRCWKRSCYHRIPSTCLRWMRWPFEAFFYVFSTPKSSRNLRGLRTLAPCRTVWSLFIHLENIFLTTLSCCKFNRWAFKLNAIELLGLTDFHWCGCGKQFLSFVYHSSGKHSYFHCHLMFGHRILTLHPTKSPH